MTKYVIGPDVAMRLAHERAVLADEHQILSPTLLRSHVLSSLYQAVQRGELTKRDADEHLDYIRGLRIRLLGDRVSNASPGRSPPSWGGQTHSTPSTSR